MNIDEQNFITWTEHLPIPSQEYIITKNYRIWSLVYLLYQLDKK